VSQPTNGDEERPPRPEEEEESTEQTVGEEVGGDSAPSDDAMNHNDSPDGTFLSLDVKGCKDRQIVCADRVAPTHKLELDENGYVPYRHDTLLVKQYSAGKGGNCLLEALVTASGMHVGELKVNASSLEQNGIERYGPDLDGRTLGNLDLLLQKIGSPFKLLNTPINGDRKWTLLFGFKEGVYIARSLVHYTEGPQAGKYGSHFIVYDAWRDLLIIGAGHAVLRVQEEDKKDEETAREFMLTHYSLQTPLSARRVCISANRVSETRFNTPWHYKDLEEKRKNKNKMKKRRKRTNKMDAAKSLTEMDVEEGMRKCTISAGCAD